MRVIFSLDNRPYISKREKSLGERKTDPREQTVGQFRGTKLSDQTEQVSTILFLFIYLTPREI